MMMKKGNEVRALTDEFHIRAEFSLENLAHENQAAVFLSVAEAVAYQPAVDCGGELGSKISNLISVAEDDEPWVMFANHFTKRESVAVRRIVGEQWGVDTQDFLKVNCCELCRESRDALTQENGTHRLTGVASELLPGGKSLPRGASQFPALMFREDQNLFRHSKKG